MKSEVKLSKKEARDKAIDFLQRKADFFEIEMSENEDYNLSASDIRAISKELKFLMSKVFKCSLK